MQKPEKTKKSSISAGEKKRRELSSLVKRTLGVKNRVLFKRLEWEDILGGPISCGYLQLRGDGNVLSLYTLSQRERHENYPSFDAVEISLFQKRYEKLACKIEGVLQRNGYSARMTKHYSSEDFSWKEYEREIEKHAKRIAKKSGNN